MIPSNRETIEAPRIAFEDTGELDLFALASSEPRLVPFTADDVLSLMASLKEQYQDTPFFLFSRETYRSIQRANSQRPHLRKLRKCHLRKLVAKQRRERRQYR